MAIQRNSLPAIISQKPKMPARPFLRRGAAIEKRAPLDYQPAVSL